MRDLFPEVARLAILVEDRDAQVLPRNSQLFGDELPGEADRLGLEVVAEGKIAEHLEERVMARGVADLLEVVVLSAGAHALLARGRAAIAVGRRLVTEEYLLELHHPRVGEQQGGIVAGNERRTGPDDVVLAREVVEEAAADLGGLHAGKSNRGRVLGLTGARGRARLCRPGRGGP